MSPRALTAATAAFTLAAATGFAPAVARAAVDGDGTVTLPLAELLRLHEKGRARDDGTEARPPVGATVTRLELAGRLLDSAIDVTAHVEVEVLDDDEWVTVRLVRKDAATRVARLPTVEHAVFTVADGYLSLVTRKAGRYAFDLSLLVAAQSAGARHKAEIGFHDAAMSVLRVRFDEGLFRLVNGDGIREEEGYSLYPQGNRFTVQWERTPSAARVAATARAERPPVESVVTAAHASVVSTLEGRRISRVLYELRFEGSRAIEFTLPQGQRLQTVFVNGAAVAATPRDRTLALQVTPARAGDEAARVELVLVEEQGGYALSGRLDYAFPATSWSVDELQVTLCLPAVFNYEWAGGSLAPVDAAPEVEYSHRIPTPGKRIHLRQQLLSTAASARLAYTVDLSGSYYH